LKRWRKLRQIAITQRGARARVSPHQRKNPENRERRDGEPGGAEDLELKARCAGSRAHDCARVLGGARRGLLSQRDHDRDMPAGGSLEQILEKGVVTVAASKLEHERVRHLAAAGLKRSVRGGRQALDLGAI